MGRRGWSIIRASDFSSFCRRCVVVLNVRYTLARIGIHGGLVEVL